MMRAQEPQPANAVWQGGIAVEEPLHNSMNL
jgi:hypothetical protein